MKTCRICNNDFDNKTYVVREMQIGYRDEFEYFECSSCGCLQISEIPADLSKYYPKEYYSYQSAATTVKYKKTGLSGIKECFIRNQITSYYLNRANILGSFLEERSCLSEAFPLWMRKNKLNLKLNRSSKILDVGSGTGKLLLELSNHGLTNLTGIDPFIEQDIRYSDTVRILRQSLDSVVDTFDFIMLNHSFEHMPKPAETLAKLSEILKPDSYLLVRIPVAGSYGWRKYGINWFALDAPRHLFLHTNKSMLKLAEEAGFDVADVLYDSEGSTLWASEQYLKDIPLMDGRSAFVDPEGSMFTKAQLESFDAQASELNDRGEADCAAFFLYKR